MRNYMPFPTKEKLAMNSLERYKIADAKIRFLTGSAMRINAVLNLMDGDMSAKILSNELACSITTINHVLRDLMLIRLAFLVAHKRTRDLAFYPGLRMIKY
jgi:hypothetical protein